MSQYTQCFTGRAADYDRYRERYDAAVVLPRLQAWCGLTSEWVVADVGAGTGMLSDLFLANGNRVLAIEPNADMRSACEEIHTGQSLLSVIDASAESTMLEPHAVDLVAVGRAMHWFDMDRAFAEFRRIVRPGGWFVSVAYGRAGDGRDENLAFEEILRTHRPGGRTTQVLTDIYRRLPEAFSNRNFHHEEVSGEIQLTSIEVRGLALSLSNVPREGHPGFAAFEQALQEFFSRFAIEDRIRFTTRYWINAGVL